MENVENRVTYENCKGALDDLFAFFGVMWASGLAMLDQFAEKLKLPPEEAEATTERLKQFHIDMFEDAMKLVKW